jgi:SOS-response transcriptional repressor LexA
MMALPEARRLREAAEQSLEDVSARVGISTSQLSRIETGRREARISEALRLARYYKVSISHILDEEPAIVVPVISWVSAGRLADPQSPTPLADAKLISFNDLGAGDYFGLRVQGDSMDRVSPEGSIIIVNRREREKIVGKPYVFSIRGEATYKVWRDAPERLAPFSTNPANEPIFPRRDADYEIIGRVRRTVLDL